jgi:hypothetical protein
MLARAIGWLKCAAATVLLITRPGLRHFLETVRKISLAGEKNNSARPQLDAGLNFGYVPCYAS